MSHFQCPDTNGPFYVVNVICCIVCSCKLQRLTVPVHYDETPCSLLLLDSQLAACKDPGPLQMNLLILSYTRTSYIAPEL
jgi:hypothetical protein